MKARDNPLATHRVLAIRYRPLDVTWPELIDRLKAMNFRAAIVGPKGSGKTTLIEDLADLLGAHGLAPRLIQLSQEQRVIDSSLLSNLTANDIVLLDGAEQLSWTRWRWCHWKSRRAGGLIVTSHCPGRMPTWIQTQTTPCLLAEITHQLLGHNEPSPCRIEQLFLRHHGNLREALRELYDEFALLPSQLAD